MSKLSASRLHESVQSLIDMHDHPAVLIDRAYRIIAANCAYRTTYGVKSEQLIGRHCYEVSHHRDTPCHLHGEDCPHQQVFACGEIQRVVHTHFDGKGRPEYVGIKGHPVVLPDGETYLGESIQRLAPPEAMNCEEMRMVGRSRPLLHAIDQLSQAAASPAPVLLTGESGVGKELAARYLHDHSPRRGGPFVAIDCTTLPENLFESEMFGHEAGAFTGCVGRKAGLFEDGCNGTLFLDEIGEIPLAMQAKLLRVLESGTFRRVGGRETLHADVRLVAATNRDLKNAVAGGLFREDLYYRIACITIALPSLRERRADIPLLVEALLARINAANGRHARLSEAAWIRLMQHDFPGNVRELRNVLQRAVALCHEQVIEPGDLGLEETGTDIGAATAPNWGGLEREQLEALAERYQGKRRAMADALGVSERTLYRRLRRHGFAAPRGT
ncbi:sigma 54-interacting transcriptional regulator [Acidiferrobacter sp.]|jgi:transcriptional regulator with PAS, ATPase and Fis domain|uniref:sigma-54 interaction domain-containing protein n=1 Tax=Acidiferrobacter sp. TaxID=1872107 RepID=UPI00260A7633|nr:sigma 54-interacting transcriptional regulator [Acidiferrobacter sp.]